MRGPFAAGKAFYRNPHARCSRSQPPREPAQEPVKGPSASTRRRVPLPRRDARGRLRHRGPRHPPHPRPPRRLGSPRHPRPLPAGLETVRPVSAMPHGRPVHNRSRRRLPYTSSSRARSRGRDPRLSLILLCVLFLTGRRRWAPMAADHAIPRSVNAREVPPEDPSEVKPVHRKGDGGREVRAWGRGTRRRASRSRTAPSR